MNLLASSAKAEIEWIVFKQIADEFDLSTIDEETLKKRKIPFQKIKQKSMEEQIIFEPETFRYGTLLSSSPANKSVIFVVNQNFTENQLANFTHIGHRHLITFPIGRVLLRHYSEFTAEVQKFAINYINEFCFEKTSVEFSDKKYELFCSICGQILESYFIREGRLSFHSNCCPDATKEKLKEKNLLLNGPEGISVHPEITERQMFRRNALEEITSFGNEKASRSIIVGFLDYLKQQDSSSSSSKINFDFIHPDLSEFVNTNSKDQIKVAKYFKEISKKSNYSLLLLPFYSPNHWSLGIMKNKKFYYYDSLGADGSFEEKLLSIVPNLIHIQNETKLEEFPACSFPLQKDSISCGWFVLQTCFEVVNNSSCKLKKEEFWKIIAKNPYSYFSTGE